MRNRASFKNGDEIALASKHNEVHEALSGHFKRPVEQSLHIVMHSTTVIEFMHIVKNEDRQRIAWQHGELNERLFYYSQRFSKGKSC